MSSSMSVLKSFQPSSRSAFAELARLLMENNGAAQTGQISRFKASSKEMPSTGTPTFAPTASAIPLYPLNIISELPSFRLPSSSDSAVEVSLNSQIPTEHQLCTMVGNNYRQMPTCVVRSSVRQTFKVQNCSDDTASQRGH